jgi:hypothetical protein
MYSGEYDACDVTLSVYPHRASIPKVVGSIPRHIFQACPVWIYTHHSNITRIIFIVKNIEFTDLELCIIDFPS